MSFETFLEGVAGKRPWQIEGRGLSDFEAVGYLLGPGANPLEVAVASGTRRPTLTEVRTIWNKRHGNTPSPLLLVLLYRSGDVQKAAVCGAIGSEPPVLLDLDAGQVERIAEAAIGEVDRHAAIRFLNAVLPEAVAQLPGIRNAGMFATQELREGVPSRPDWASHCDTGRKVIDKRGRELIEALGFHVESKGVSTWLLRAKGTARAIGVFLDESELPEGNYDRFGGTSPISFALAVADAEGLPYVVVTRANQVRVYGVGQVGVGRKGRAETFVEANLALLPDDMAGYLPLLFGSSALAAGGTFEQLLDRSRDFASDLGKRLRDRIYLDVVPSLARAVASQQSELENDLDLTDADLEFLYDQALVVLFRLLFVAYAEDKDLLPYRSNGLYQRHALKTLARDLAERRNAQDHQFDSVATDLWVGVRQLFRAVDQGNTDWGVPAYNGGLFSSSESVNPVGAAVDRLELTNEMFGPALAGLLVDEAEDGGFGPVDFRSLSVREFGTIYEGLLESSLSRARVDLTVNTDGLYIQAAAGEAIQVPAGEIYIHNQSGVRKASGSYFTRPFAVEHLLDQALEPALDDHLRRLGNLVDAGEEHEAAAAFFDFRCADIAMGSGHFLVAAVDRIEARLSSFLATHPVPKIVAELERLRAAAKSALGQLGEGLEIEHASLLRRQIARRCVYGVDRNDMAVELARLGLWIHTFVPGLPLSFLNHNLVCGDSLTGIGSIEEAAEILQSGSREHKSGTQSIFYMKILEWLERAGESLSKLARASDATASEIAEARSAQAQAMAAIDPARRLFDRLVRVRLGEAEAPLTLEDEPASVTEESPTPTIVALRPLHFPIAFPEVFLRKRQGFDCILGNPPWDKVRFEPQQFWVVRFPGLNALPAAEREPEIVRLREAYPDEAAQEDRERTGRELLQRYAAAGFRLQGAGSGHYDFAKLFVERALGLLDDSGSFAYVLPRQCLVLGSWAALRNAALTGRDSTCVQTQNRGGWLFEDVHQQNMHVLLATRSDDSKNSEGQVSVWGAVRSTEDLIGTRKSEPLTLDLAELREWSEGLVIPWFNQPEDVHVFDRLRAHPTLGSDNGWIKGHSETSWWDFSGTGAHRQYASTEESADAWKVLMTRHVDAFRIAEEEPAQRFLPNPSVLVDLNKGLILQEGSPVVGPDHPVILHRYASTSTNRRTMIVAALPESGFLFSKGYVHGLSTGDAGFVDVLALLGLLNTFTCDWWVRRLCDRHITPQIINSIPLPKWSEDERRSAANIAAELTRRTGLERLAGQKDLNDFARESGTDDELMVSLEVLTMIGYGLRKSDVDLIFSDFDEQEKTSLVKTAFREARGTKQRVGASASA